MNLILSIFFYKLYIEILFDIILFKFYNIGLKLRSKYLYVYNNKRKKMFTTKSVSTLTVFLYLLISSFAHAENHTIDMLNKLGKEKMVYSKKVISIKINDEVTWKSVDKGHNVEFIGMPKGVSKFKSKISKDANFKQKP